MVLICDRSNTVLSSDIRFYYNSTINTKYLVRASQLCSKEVGSLKWNGCIEEDTSNVGANKLERVLA